MINLRVLVPEATENYIQNPQFRYGTTGWTTVGSTLTRTLDFARFGIASGQVVTNGAATGEGVYYRVSSLSGISDVITISVYLRGNSGNEKVRLHLQDNPAGYEWTSEVVELRKDRWTRVEVSGRCSGGNDIRLKVETADSVAKAYTFYVDGAQMERKSYSTSYCDGDQPGCRWNLTASASNSTRTADTREGGRWIPLAGPCRPDNDIYVTVLGGLGTPPVQNNMQPWAIAPGSFFQNQKVLDRVATLNFTVKSEKLAQSGLSLSSLHELRQQLVDLFKADKTLNDEAFWFEYSDTNSDKPLYIRFRYEAGLEGSWDVRNGWFNTFALRLIAVDPFWVEDSQEVKQLTVKNTYSAATTINAFMRKNGEWLKITDSSGNHISGTVQCFAVAPDGTIYIGGAFTTPVGITRICKFDGTTLTVLGAGGANNTVYGLAVAPDGTLYAVGDFTTIGGVACNRVAKYNPTTNTWAALGTGLNSTGRTVCVAPNGQVYVGGAFTTAGGVACLRVARWDSLQWRTVGATSGVSDDVYAIINGYDGNTLYMGGRFLTSNGGGVTYNAVCSIDINTNLLSQLGTGMNSSGSPTVYSLALGLDGTVYAGGLFFLPGNTALTVFDNIGQWNGGATWLPVGTGLSDPTGGTGASVLSLSIGKMGELYAAGNFSLAGTKPLYGFGKYYGDTWSPIELVQLPPAASQNGLSILYHPNGDLFVGMGAGTGALFRHTPKINIVTNPGTAAVFPRLYIIGPGNLVYISNIKTGQEIFLYLTVLSGEEVFIDFARGTIISTTRGSLQYTLVPGSEIRSIYLLPGDNSFSVLMTEEVNPSMSLQFQPQDWSADAVVDAEALE